ESRLAWVQRDRLAQPRVAARHGLERDQPFVVVVEADAAADDGLAVAEQTSERAARVRRVPREAGVRRGIHVVAAIGRRPQIDLWIERTAERARLEERR